MLQLSFRFASYFHYCRTLRFDDKPDYAYLKRLFREVFILEGFDFDYAFDWTILKYQQAQVASTPPCALGPGVGPSSGMPPAFTNADWHSGGEEGSTSGWPEADLSCRHVTAPGINAGSFSKQKSPAINESSAWREAMGSLFFT